MGAGTGGGGGGKKSEDPRQAPTRKTNDAVDRRPNNKMLRQCPSGTAQQLPYHAIAVPTAMRNTLSHQAPLPNYSQYGLCGCKSTVQKKKTAAKGSRLVLAVRR